MTSCLPSQEMLRALLRYEPEPGRLYWRERPRDLFPRGQDWKRWNNRYAGHEAGNDHVTGYRVVKIFYKHYFAHRLIWRLVIGEVPDEIDHVNGIRNDNRWENLRAVSRAENCRNLRRRKNNISGVTGVSWNKLSKKWMSRITINGASRHLGCFDSLNEAITARQAAEEAYGFHANHGRAE